MRKDALLTRFDVRDRRARQRRLQTATELLLCEAKSNAAVQQPLAEPQVERLDGNRHDREYWRLARTVSSTTNVSIANVRL